MDTFDDALDGEEDKLDVEKLKNSVMLEEKKEEKKPHNNHHNSNNHNNNHSNNINRERKL